MAELRIHLVTIICIRLYILLITVGLLVLRKINKKISQKEKKFSNIQNSTSKQNILRLTEKRCIGEEK